jgi:hypothetical protein
VELKKNVSIAERSADAGSVDQQSVPAQVSASDGRSACESAAHEREMAARARGVAEQLAALGVPPDRVYLDKGLTGTSRARLAPDAACCRGSPRDVQVRRQNYRFDRDDQPGQTGPGIPPPTGPRNRSTLCLESLTGPDQSPASPGAAPDRGAPERTWAKTT